MKVPGASTLTAYGIANLIGGKGNNTYKFEQGGFLPGNLTYTSNANATQPNTNVLDYSNYGSPVTVNLGDVGGPSAGTMLALGIYDKLTPGALTGGERFAGTGTITADGVVGPIGGIRQKMYGAQRAGAEWFLAPEANCDEVVGHIPAGLQVFAMTSLDDAIDIVQTVADGGDTSKLATCGG